MPQMNDVAPKGDKDANDPKASGEAPKDETPGQRADKLRAAADKERKSIDNKGQDKMHLLRNPATGDELEVSQDQWRRESQILRQNGWERADALDKASSGGEKPAKDGSQGGGGV